MAGLLARLFELAAKRADLKVTEVDDIDSWGFLLFRDGRYNIFINRSVRDFRKTMALADELGHYALRRRIARREGLPPAAATMVERIRQDKACDAWAAKFTRRLLYMIRRGLHGGTSSRPRQGEYDPSWRLPRH
ncbi:ImmA/IrrE family metallo-endopeptidase [Solidesulfovibrio sp.]|uniref:ImmA/IrrE family metallo-endopeptidase n=1 Tax=Solidesulfovibrio sp. TaxID=2910990 RepID=UPI000EEA2094|nr:ImmA/IrrE family metallo-endopeptidase [Solidesulfovibrio sp.]MEA5090326.1 ImmA/IrrE family metallo-endopeptidase [Solidesulfovibrio sp.]HCR13958.1 ImmA/IrrE family metallo-endopeptidase [Desulfovibrio sp.]HML60693.1 ImmA/IrrE family metallo-endopeptidase [Solidesulfovibrio sp.]